MSLIDQLPSILGGAGSGLATYGALWAQGRHSRTKMAQDLFDRIMTGVREENSELHKKVAECERRDARVLVIETCFRLVVPELQRAEPHNRTLTHVASLLRGLPVEPNSGEWAELLARIDAADEAHRRSK